MKKLLIAFLLIACTATAQEREIKFTMSQISEIRAALAELKFKDVGPVVNFIDQQVYLQNKILDSLAAAAAPDTMQAKR